MRTELYLGDTSFWLEVLPAGRATPELRQRIDALLAIDRVAATGVVLLELLGGARNDDDYHRVREMLSALHNLPTSEARWSEAADLVFRLRRGGVTAPFTDILIAAVAIAEGATLVHRDRHFDSIARHVPLAVESHVPAMPGS